MKSPLIVSTCLLLVSGSLVLATPSFSSVSLEGTTFTTPGLYTCVVPEGVMSATWSIRGGDGGSGPTGTEAVGGVGALVSGVTAVTPGEVLFVTVGGNGEDFDDGSTGVSSAGGGGGYSSIARGSYSGTPLGIAGGGGGSAVSFPGGAGGYQYTGAEFIGGGDGESTRAGLRPSGGAGAFGGADWQVGGNGGASGRSGSNGSLEPTYPSTSIFGGGGGGGGFGGLGGAGSVGDPTNYPGAAGGFASGGSSGYRSGGGGGGYGGGGGGNWGGTGGGGSSLMPVGGSALSIPGGHPMTSFDFFCMAAGTNNVQIPDPILQQLPANPDGTCSAIADSAVAYGTGLTGGWNPSWAQWSNAGKGGPVCTRTLTFDPIASRWTVT